jgi:hypothetical protein
MSSEESILAASKACSTLFQNLVSCNLPAVAEWAEVAEQQLAKFNLWADSLGVYAPFHAAADHRLRDQPDIRDLILSLLEILTTKVQILLNGSASNSD